jgi:hypothetical protein
MEVIAGVDPPLLIGKHTLNPKSYPNPKVQVRALSPRKRDSISLDQLVATHQGLKIDFRLGQRRLLLISNRACSSYQGMWEGVWGPGALITEFLYCPDPQP